MEKREGFVFYRSFYEALKELPADAFKAILSALAEYALDGTEPELSGFEMAAFLLMKPQVDANNQRRENGAKGGRRTEKPNETKANQTEPKEKDKVKDKVKDNTDPLCTSAGEGFPDKPEEPSPEPAEMATCEAIPLNDGSEWLPTREEFDEYVRLYPGIDVSQAFRTMRGWCLANRANRKTKAGVRRFVASWLSREQNRARPSPGKKKRTAFENFPQHDTDYDALAWSMAPRAKT